MVFIDTDVLSIFAKIQRLPLLFTIFCENLLNISAAVEIDSGQVLQGLQLCTRHHGVALAGANQDVSSDGR